MDNFISVLTEVNKGIKAKQFAHCYLLYGNEFYFIDKIVSNIKKSFEDPSGLNIKIYNDENYNADDAIKYILNMPFMNDKKLIIFDNVDTLKQKKEKLKLEQMVDNIKVAKDTNILVFIFESIESKNDKKKAESEKTHNPLISYLLKNAVSINSKKISAEDITKYLDNYFKKSDISIDKITLAYFVKKVGKNLTFAYNEADKLISYVGDKNVVTKEDIDNIASKNIEDTIYNLIDFINTGNRESALMLYGELIEEENKPYDIFKMVKNNFSSLLMTKDLTENGKSFKEICDILEVPYNMTWKVRKYIDANKYLTKEYLKKKINIMTDYEYKYMMGQLSEENMTLNIF